MSNRDAMPHNPHDTLAVLDAAIQIGYVLELVESGKTSCSPAEYTLLERAHNVLMGMAPEPPPDDEEG